MVQSFYIGQDTELENRKDWNFCDVLLHGALQRIVVLPEGVHRTLDKGGEDIHGAVFFIEYS